MPQLNPSFYYTTPKLNGKLVNKDVISFSTQLVLQEAEKIGITWELLAGSEIFCLSLAGKTSYFKDRTPISTSDLAVSSCMDKHLTKLFLSRANICTPKGLLIEQNDPEGYWWEVFNTLSKPVVVKPTKASHGDGITIGVTTLEDFSKAMKKAFAARDYADAAVEVEEEFSGKEYRITVTKEKVIGVMHRVPANVSGDGTSTIRQLVATKNDHAFRNLFESSEYQVYGKIKIDDDAVQILSEQNLTPESIPEKNTVVYLRKVSNMLQGGDGVDLTDEIHESVKEICLRAINAIPGLAIAGIDFMTIDLFSQQTENTYTIVEINHNSEFGIHHFPMVGKSRNTARDFLELLFPELKAEND